MKTVLVSKSGKRVAFAPMQVSYMIAHGWKRAVESKPKAKPEDKPAPTSTPEPAEAEKS